MLRRHDIIVGDQIMMISAAHRARESEPVHDDRSWLLRNDLCPRILRVSVEINQNVNLVTGNRLRGPIVIETIDVGPFGYR